MRRDDQYSSFNSLFLPGWWVRAFECARMHSNVATSRPLDKSLILFPVTSSGVVKMIGLLIDQILHSVASSAFHQRGAVKIGWQDCLEYLGQKKDDMETLKTAFESLGSLALKATPDDSPRSSLVSVFHEPCFETSFELNPTWHLKIQTSTLELLSGFSDGHHDFLRAIQSKPTIHNILGLDSPLTLWKPAWLAFESDEQQVYLNIEKAMQWDVSLLHLEGVFSSSIQSLFAGVDFAQDVHQTRSTLLSRLHLLDRVGQTLVEHGVTTRSSEPNYYACAGDLLAGSPAVIWQTTPLRMSEDSRSFYAEAFEQVRRQDGPEAIMELWRLLAPPQTRRSEDIQELWYAASELPGAIIKTGPNTIIQAHTLFFEIALRKSLPTGFPLPDKMKGDGDWAMCSLWGNLGENFEKFLKFVSDPAMAAFWSSEDIVSVGQLVSRGEKSHFLNLRDTIQSKNASVTVSDAQSLDINSARAKVHLTESAADLLVSSGDAQNARSSILADSKMIRIASDELENMFRSDIRAYENLRESYLKSLEDSQRSLMLDFQKRMKPSIFEQQLKQRLVRYMVSHPSEWRSTRVSLQ